MTQKLCFHLFLVYLHWIQIIAVTNLNDINVLHSLYSSLDGSQWWKNWDGDLANTQVWNFTTENNLDPCGDSWYGITCYHNKSSNVSFVSAIELGGINLYGMIPVSINKLTALLILNFTSNIITGTIPKLNSTTLRTLDLSNNRLSGSIPDFTNLPQLRYLNLSLNQLSRSIPDFTGLPELSSLDLYENQLSGSIPDFINLTNLSYLILYNNKLSGSIPNFANLPQLTYLELSGNQLSGSIPDFTNLPRLKVLLLYNNRLSRSIPNFSNLPQLIYLDLDTNQLSGTIPDFSNLSQLILLSLYSNKLSAFIPNFSNFPQLRTLNLSHNHISGSIPDFSNLPQLSILYLSFNQLSASIPNFSHLPQLSELELSSNQLFGTIPDFSHLPQLNYLDLSANRLSGSIPYFTNLPQLNNLNLSTNHLFGSVPDFANIQFFDVSVNYLYGSLPSFQRSPTLSFLIVSQNYLSGTVSISDLHFLTTLSLSQNYFTGSIDQLFDSTVPSNFSIIDISSNSFVGTIPVEIIQLPSLQIFSAGSNCIEGSIPSEFCLAMNLVALSLDGLGTAENCQNPLFSGSNTHTYSLKHPIRGSIPPCLFELSTLQVLHVSGNGLTGTLPEYVQLSSNLTDLSVSYNRLKGSLPNNIQAHPWKNLDISVNKINGVLLQDLQSLKNERFSFFVNRLSGSLPDSVFNRSINLNILNGNIFDCAVVNGQNVLPTSDPNHDSYSCGSQTANNSLIVWLCFSCLALLGCLVRFFLFRYDRPVVESMKQRINEVEERGRLWWNMTNSETGLFKDINVNRLFILLRRVSALLFCLIICLFLPVYGALWTFRTHTYSYIWIVSLAYLSGQVPAILLFFIILLCFAILFVFQGYFITHERDNPVIKTTLLPFTPQLNWYSVMAKVLIVFSNAVMALAINFGYVYLLSLSLNETQRISLEVFVAVCKLIWSVTFIKRIFLVLMKRAQWIQEDLSTFGTVQFLSSLYFFNLIVAPMIAAAFFDSNCFKNTVFTPSKVQTTYSAVWQTEFENNEIYLADVEIVPSTYVGSQTYQSSFSYSPPFIYNNQCTSSLLSEFATVFIYKYALSTFLVLIGSLSILLALRYNFYSEIFVAGFLPKQFYFTMMKLKKEKTLWTPFARVEVKILPYFSFLLRKDENDNKCFDGELVIIGIIGDLAVLLTFGIAFPPLGVIICFSICFQTILHQLLLGRLMCELEESIQKNNAIREAIELGTGEENKEHKGDETVWDLPEQYLVFLKKETAPLMRYFQPSIKYLAIFSAIFLSFFLFDILADDVGIAAAIWIIPVTSCLPILIFVIHQLGMKLSEEYQHRHHERIPPAETEDKEDLNISLNYMIPHTNNEVIENPNRTLSYAIPSSDNEDTEELSSSQNYLIPHAESEDIENLNSHLPYATPSTDIEELNSNLNYIIPAATSRED